MGCSSPRPSQWDSDFSMQILGRHIRSIRDRGPCTENVTSVPVTLRESKSNLITRYNLGRTSGLLWWMPSFWILFLSSFFFRVLKCSMWWKRSVVDTEYLWLVPAQGCLKCSEILQLRGAITSTKIYLKSTSVLKMYTKLSAMNCEGDTNFSKPPVTNPQMLASLATEKTN